MDGRRCSAADNYPRRTSHNSQPWNCRFSLTKHICSKSKQILLQLYNHPGRVHSPALRPQNDMQHKLDKASPKS